MELKLYHSTPMENLESILEKGLLRGGLGKKGFIVYLSPTLETAYRKEGRVILEVETENIRLTAFDDCKEWEVLCWGDIPPKNIKVIEICKGDRNESL